MRRWVHGYGPLLRHYPEASRTYPIFKITNYSTSELSIIRSITTHARVQLTGHTFFRVDFVDMHQSNQINQNKPLTNQSRGETNIT